MRSVLFSLLLGGLVGFATTRGRPDVTRASVSSEPQEVSPPSEGELAGDDASLEEVLEEVARESVDQLLQDYSAARAAFLERGDVPALRGIVHALSSAPGVRTLDIGVGRDGRPMLFVEVAASAGAPGVVVLHRGSEPRGGVDRDALALADLAFELARLEPEARGDRRIVIGIGARPDRLAPRLPSTAIDPARNFPVDREFAVRRDAAVGDYPLQAPETRALARWLDSDAALFAAVLLGQGGLAPEDLSAGDRVADAALAAIRGLEHVSAAGGAADEHPELGGLGRHAALRAGLAVVGLQQPLLLERDSETSQRIATAVRAVAQAGPRLAITLEEDARPVGSDVWRLDVALKNVGLLPTANAVHGRERLARWIALDLEGAEWVAAAAARAGGAFEVLETRAPRAENELSSEEGASAPSSDSGAPALRLVDLGPGETLRLRLFIRPRAIAPEGADGSSSAATEPSGETVVEARAEAQVVVRARAHRADPGDAAFALLLPR